MQEQQLTQFYDKLLHYLNRTYATNIRTQELYLDLKKHTRKLRFKSIKNIYNTLTEGKADEVIYSKQKHSLTKNSLFNQKFTERTCWRLIEKLINKIAYYLMNEKKLDCLALSILKTLNFTRNAPEKVTHKAAFVQFFSEVLDTMIAQNNLLEQKIYQLLIQRGYIQSIDEFYRMSRFQGPDADFTYSNPEGQQQSDFFYNSQQAPSIDADQIKINCRANLIKSRKRMMSIRKFVHSRNQSKFESFDLKNIEEDLPKIEQNIEQSESQADSQDLSDSEPQDSTKYNKIVNTIHQQVEKLVDQIMNHKDFEAMLASSNHQGFSISNNGEKVGPKQSILKQVLKNLKIKNFKANEKLLIMTSNSRHKIEPLRKNSKPKEQNQFQLRKGKVLKNEKNRASIATALSSRMRQKIMKSSGIQQIKQLVVRNLGSLQNKYEENQANQITKVRKNKRLQTQTFEVNLQQSKFQRRSSNLNFLRNAFIFNSDSKSRIVYQQNNQLRGQRYADLLNQSQLSSENASITLKSIGSCKSKQHQNSFLTLQKSKQLFTNDRIAKLSRFGAKNPFPHVTQNKDFNKKTKSNFNPVLLQLAAKKYHRCSTEENNLKSVQELFYAAQTEASQKKIQLQQLKQRHISKKESNLYMHHRRYQTFDRLHRRIL